MTTANLTINDNDTVVQYESTGESVFVGTFPILDEDEVKVSVDQEEQVLGVDYTVSGVGDEDGFLVTFASATTAGELITIWLDMSIERLTGFPTGAAVLTGQALNTEFARQVRHDQMLRRDIRRALRIPVDDPDGGQDMQIPGLATRKGRFLAFDATTGEPIPSAGTGADAGLREDLAGTVGGLIGVLEAEVIKYAVTNAETDALVTPTNLSIAPYIRGRYANFADWKAACDEAGAEGSLDADYALTANIALPRRCHFKGFELTGAYYSKHSGNLNGGYVHEWRAVQPWISGGNGNRYTGIHTGGSGALPSDSGFIRVDGGGVGLEWCQGDIIYTNELELSNDDGFVNQNTFQGGVARHVHLTGSSSDDMHSNKFNFIDATDNSGHLQPSGYLQDDAKFQVNYIIGGYYEDPITGSTTIVGNWEVRDINADSTSYPQLSRHRSLLTPTGTNERIAKGMMSISVANVLPGGEWNILDGSGKPAGFSHDGGASVQVVVDATEPAGNGLRYQATFADANDRFSITIPPCGSNNIGLWLYYKSTADFVAIESTFGSGTSSYTPNEVTVSGDWKLIRMCVIASPTLPTTVYLYAYAGVGGAAKTMSLGSVFAGQEGHIVCPQRQVQRFRYGSAAYDPGSLADGEGVTTTVTVTGAALGNINVSVSFSQDLQGITVTAWVSAANTVSVRFQNESGGVVDLAAGTLRVQVQEPFA